MVPTELTHELPSERTARPTDGSSRMNASMIVCREGLPVGPCGRIFQEVLHELGHHHARAAVKTPFLPIPTLGRDVNAVSSLVWLACHSSFLLVHGLLTVPKDRLSTDESRSRLGFLSMRWNARGQTVHGWKRSSARCWTYPRGRP